MAGMRFGHRLHFLKFVAPLGGIALWMCAGCAAKKADLPPPKPLEGQTQTPASGPSPSVTGQSPANRGGAPGGGPASGRDVGQTPTDLRSGPMFVHKVRYHGESVSIIAGWYTGAVENWKVLAEVNPGIKPDVIHAGMNINIPISLLKKRDPMTKEYVNSFHPKAKSKTKGTGTRGHSSTPAGEETPLFGPKH